MLADLLFLQDVRTLFHGVMGISMRRMLRGEWTSTTALTNAAGEPTFGDLPTPLVPKEDYVATACRCLAFQRDTFTAVGTR